MAAIDGLEQKLMEALPIGEIDGPSMDRRAQRLAEIAAPDLTIEMISSEGGLRTEFLGIDGYREAWGDWLEPFANYRVELEEARETPAGLLVFTRQTATPKGTDAPMHGEAAALIKFRDGKVSRIEFHLDRESAERAAAVDPQSIQE